MAGVLLDVLAGCGANRAAHFGAMLHDDEVVPALEPVTAAHHVLAEIADLPHASAALFCRIGVINDYGFRPVQAFAPLSWPQLDLGVPKRLDPDLLVREVVGPRRRSVLRRAEQTGRSQEAGKGGCEYPAYVLGHLGPLKVILTAGSCPTRGIP